MIQRRHKVLIERGQRGLSLIELMIGITLGMVVISAVLYVFAGNRASYRHQESLSAVQETGRFVLELLARDLRMAGYAGCSNIGFVENLSPSLFTNALAIVGTTGANAATPDSITIRRGGVASTALTAMATTSQIDVNNASLLGDPGPGTLMLVTDCTHLEVFTLSSVTGNRITASPALSRTFPVGSQIMRFEQVQYDIVAPDQLRRTVNGAAQIVADGVRNLKISYGTGPNYRANRYIATPAWPDTQVVSARVDLQVVHADIRHRFSTVISLRNRTP